VLKSRLSKATAGFAVITVGKNSATESLAVAQLAEDAAKATLSAMKDGVIVGGGKVYQLIYNELLAIGTYADFYYNMGYQAFVRAIITPLVAIVGEQWTSEMIWSHYNQEKTIEEKLVSGVDVKEWAVCPNLIEAGIIDPAEASKKAIEAALSVATTLLKTKYIFIKEETK
jgi:chaperonin GroEL